MKNMENKEQQAVFVLEKTEYVNNVKEYRILKKDIKKISFLDYAIC